MIERAYLINKVKLPEDSADWPSQIRRQLYEPTMLGRKPLSLKIIVRTFNDQRFPNEVEILDGLHGRAAKVSDGTMSRLLVDHMARKSEVPEYFVQEVQTKGYPITYDMGEA